MGKTPVVSIRCTSYEQTSLQEALARLNQLLGGWDRFVRPGDRVLIKPNFIAPKSVNQPAQTHPQVIIEVGRMLKDMGALPVVGDSPAWGTVFSCARALNLTDPLKYLGIPLRPLDSARKCRINEHTTVGISALALDVDAIINLPKLKAHQQMVATLALKNMFGCVTGKKKPYWHFARGTSPERFADFLLDVYRQCPATLSIVDGIIAMQGNGPINGEVYPLGWLVAGPDAVACEAVCAHLIGLEPDRLPLLRAAKRATYGRADLTNIECLGDSILDYHCMDFQIPDQVPIRFSPPRVVKSILKGMLVSLKSAWKPTTHQSLSG